MVSYYNITANKKCYMLTFFVWIILMFYADKEYYFWWYTSVVGAAMCGFSCQPNTHRISSEWIHGTILLLAGHLRSVENRVGCCSPYRNRLYNSFCLKVRKALGSARVHESNGWKSARNRLPTRWFPTFNHENFSRIILKFWVIKKTTYNQHSSDINWYIICRFIKVAATPATVQMMISLPDTTVWSWQVRILWDLTY